MTFVDTNYFLRFLLKDNNLQHRNAKQLFLSAARGEIEVATSLIVFFEVYWVLKSYYEKKKDELNTTLNKILSLTFIKLAEREKLTKSLKLFASTTLSLEDCYNLILAKELAVENFASFDEKLKKHFKLSLR